MFYSINLRLSLVENFLFKIVSSFIVLKYFDIISVDPGHWHVRPALLGHVEHMNAWVHYTLIRFIQIRFSRPLVEAGDDDLVSVLSTQVMAFLLHMTLRLSWI